MWKCKLVKTDLSLPVCNLTHFMSGSKMNPASLEVSSYTILSLSACTFALLMVGHLDLVRSSTQQIDSIMCFVD